MMWAGCPRTGLCIKPLFTSYAATPVPPSACPQETATGPSSLLEATTLVLSLEFQFHFTRRLKISTLAYMSGFFPNFPRFLCHPPPPHCQKKLLFVLLLPLHSLWLIIKFHWLLPTKIYQLYLFPYVLLVPHDTGLTVPE